MKLLLAFAGIIVFAVLFLKGFDRIAGRGPGQVAKGVREYERK